MNVIGRPTRSTNDQADKARAVNAAAEERRRVGPNVRDGVGFATRAPAPQSSTQSNNIENQHVVPGERAHVVIEVRLPPW